MYWIAIAITVLGLLLLLIGYSRKRRGMLAVSALVLFVAGSLGGFLDRWVNTAKQAEAEARNTLETPPTLTPLPLPPPRTPAPAPPTP